MSLSDFFLVAIRNQATQTDIIKHTHKLLQLKNSQLQE